MEEFAYHFVNQANDELGKDVDTISTEVIDVLKQQSWHGNLRELRNVIRRSVLFAQDNVLRKENLPDFPKENKNHTVVKAETQEIVVNESLSLNNKANEKEQILAALKQARGNKTIAAKLLQIDRKTLYNKMHLYGIEL